MLRPLSIVILLALLVPAVARAQAAAPAPEAAAAPAAAAAPVTPAAPAAPAPGGPGGAAAGTGTADEQFDMRVKGLEEHVNDLKEKIFRTKARLLLLNEKVMGGDLLSGAKAVVYHRNEMGGSFVLETVAYQLDGAPIYTKVDVDGDLDKRDEIEIFNGRIVPGRHTVSVRMVYRGNGFGLFKYLEGYKFKVSQNYDFTAEGGRVTTIKVIGYEKGGITTDLKERPGVRFDVAATKDVPTRKDEAKQ